MSARNAGRVLLALAAWMAHAGAAEQYHLIENFTTPLPGSPTVACEVETAAPRAGLGTARLRYKIEGQRNGVQFPDGAYSIPCAGMMKVWMKGDGSGNEVEFAVRHARTRTDNEGRKIFYEHGQVQLPRVKLDFSEWREISLDLRTLPEGRVAWWAGLQVHGTRPDPKKNPNPVLAGVIELDDLRLVPAGAKPGAAFKCGLIGPTVRSLTKDFAFYADVRSFSSKPARMRARFTMLDRNGNKVAEKDFPLEIEANASREFKLDLEPENVEAYLPPFMVTGDVLSTDLVEAAATIEQPIVVGNAALLVEDFSNVFGRWFTAGYDGQISSKQRAWVEWTHGEGPRAGTLIQDSAAISRVPMEAAPAQMPVVPFAMKLDFNGEAAVYTGADRYLPGNAYRLGFWIKGDGSGAKLFALTLDYTNGADFWPGGWKRTYNGESQLCTLDFTDWRYIEIELPGDGLGSSTPRGSTDGIDFPLELTAFRVQPMGAAKSGSVQFGPIVARTQIAAASTLSAYIGYDNPDFVYGPAHNAWVTVQNGALSGERKLRGTWTVLDRGGETVASGPLNSDAPAGAAKVLKIDFAQHAAAFAKKAGPFQLQAVVSDAADPSISVSRQVTIAKPDSLARFADFESERGYYGWKSGSQWTAATSTEQARGGARSLKIVWQKESGAEKEKPAVKGKIDAVAVGIDPALPGVPSEISMQVFGDGSGAIFYPVIGGMTGVNHGANQNNFFLARRAGAAPGELQNGVKVDWKGWRDVTFILPQIPAGWDRQGKVLPFVFTYPLGMHLFVDGADATVPSGAVYVDDIVVATHLPPNARVAIALERPGESNVNPDGRQVLSVWNHDAAAARNVTVACGVYDWRNARVAGQDVVVEIKSGEKKQVVISEKLPAGAYTVRAQLKEGDATLATLEDDIVVCDLKPYLGEGWPTALRDEWKLRGPVKDAFAFIDEDWDWVEHHPGNAQVDTIRERAAKATAQGGRPHVLLGYGAYWSAGIGFEQMKAGAFSRRQRDIGHAVDIFMVPARMEDWENYVCEVMRGAGGDVNGWMLWDNPDSAGPMKVDPPKFAQMIGHADAWRETYCPNVPLLIGGMNRGTAIPYLNQLREQKIGSATALDHIGGVQVRLDVGRMSPEDAEIQAYVRELKEALKSSGKEKTVLLSDLDWAVEKDAAGLSGFDQAAYLSRAAFLLDEAGIRPLLSIRNEDSVRLGLGLVYRRQVVVPPMSEKVLAHDFKPAWWAMVRTRQWLDEMTFVGAVEVSDTIPGRTQCLLYKRSDGKSAAVVWRNDDAGHVEFASTGLAVEAAEDVLATPVTATDGWFVVGKMPIVVRIDAPADRAKAALAKLGVRDGATQAWTQRVIDDFSAAESHEGYSHNGAAFKASGRDTQGNAVDAPGVRFAKDGKETLTVKALAGASIVLRKRYLLDDAGQEARVSVNGAPAGTWNLRRSEQKLSGGIRDAFFVVPAELLKGQGTIEIQYTTPANTMGWRVHAYDGGAFPLTALGPVHADQNFGHLRLARNVTGSRLKIGTTEFANGIGVFAQSLIEYPLNRQFAKFMAKVGVDAVTEGKGSVVFDVFADGKKIWSSGVMSGLDQPKAIDVDVKNVDRLRLVVTDAGDGNRFDAGVWCDPELTK